MFWREVCVFYASANGYLSFFVLQVKVHLVVVAYHKMLGPDMQRDVLGRLTGFERKLAEDKLGQVMQNGPLIEVYEVDTFAYSN